MVREISFLEHRDAIAQLRRETYEEELIHDIDEFDEVAHHFALFNAEGEITGAIRVLRSDEVPSLELQSESAVEDLLFPKGLTLEVSRGCSREGAALMKMALAMQDYAKKESVAHVVAKTDSRLLPLYRALGFRVFGKPFYSDWFNERQAGLPSIPIIYDFVKPVPTAAVEEEEVLVW